MVLMTLNPSNGALLKSIELRAYFPTFVKSSFMGHTYFDKLAVFYYDKVHFQLVYFTID